VIGQTPDDAHSETLSDALLELERVLRRRRHTQLQ
jgi:hypothetical protein